MPDCSDDNSLFSRMEKMLYSPVISDALDEATIRNHTMNRNIKPLNDGVIVAGRAKTILISEIYEIKEEPYKLMIEASDSLRLNDVAIVGTNDSEKTAAWGELFSTASRVRGARGVIVDGLTRDTRKILAMDYPVFSVGTIPLDSKGRAEVIDYDCPVRSGDTVVNPGDIVFADVDGVVVIPGRASTDVIAKAFEKATKENLVRKDLLKGSLLRDAWARHKVL